MMQERKINNRLFNLCFRLKLDMFQMTIKDRIIELSTVRSERSDKSYFLYVLGLLLLHILRTSALKRSPVVKGLTNMVANDVVCCER